MSYSFTLTGPSLAMVPVENPFATNFPIAAAPRVQIILDLFAIIVDERLLTAPGKSPPSACCTELAAPVDCKRLIAAPASTALMLNDFLALRRGAFLLAAIDTDLSSTTYI